MFDLASLTYDLRASIDAAISAIESKLSTLPEGRTLFVAFGEDHYNPYHALAQQGILQQLGNKGISCSFGYELDLMSPFRRLTESLKNFDLGMKPHELPDDPLGWKALTAMLACDPEPYAGDYASHNLFAHCHAHGIPTFFNDAKCLKRQDGEYPRYFIDLDHEESKPLTARFRDASDVFGSGGMALRNAVMVNRSIRQAADTSSRVFLQHTGTYHAIGGACDYGDSVRHNAFDVSLSGLWQEAGQDTLAVIPVNAVYNETHFTAEGKAMADRGDIVLIRDIPGDGFYDNDALNASCQTYARRIAETSVKTIAARANGGIELYDLKNVRKKTLADVRHQGSTWVEQTPIHGLNRFHP